MRHISKASIACVPKWHNKSVFWILWKPRTVLMQILLLCWWFRWSPSAFIGFVVLRRAVYQVPALPIWVSKREKCVKLAFIFSGTDRNWGVKPILPRDILPPLKHCILAFNVLVFSFHLLWDKYFAQTGVSFTICHDEMLNESGGMKYYHCALSCRYTRGQDLDSINIFIVYMNWMQQLNQLFDMFIVIWFSKGVESCLYLHIVWITMALN